MAHLAPPSLLAVLHNAIDLTQAPFSDRGSRILLYQARDSSALRIKLAERMTDVEPGLAAHLIRPPFIDNLTLLDAAGEPLAFEAVTYPHAIFLRTSVGEFVCAFQSEDVLAIGLPPGEAVGLRMDVQPFLIHESRQTGDIRATRNFAYATTGEITQRQATPIDGGHRLTLQFAPGEDEAVALCIRADQALNAEATPFSRTLDAAEARWLRWFEAAPPVEERYCKAYLYAWWVMANNIVSPGGCITREAMMPSKSHYIGLWQWDSYFHALAYRHVDPALAEDQIRVILDNQLDNGMLPDAIYDEGTITSLDFPVEAPVTKPPLGAWAALKVHRLNPNTDFLRAIYRPLVRNVHWWFSQNDDDTDGIVQYTHPYSSGLDDNPLWDGGVPVESPDINTYLVLEQEALAEIAREIGEPDDAAVWERRADALAQRMVEHLYDADAGLFWALRDHEPVEVVTPFNLYPLITGRLPEELVEALLQQLTDPARFWARYPLPTVALDDPRHKPLTMWRGPVWINVNYLFVEGLARIGQHELADELRRRTLDLVASNEGIYEYYHPQTGLPPESAAPVFGWTAALFIELAIASARAGGG